jgi:hypothetical protein
MKHIRITQCLLTLALLFAMPLQSRSWGRDGHEIVAQIAMRYLSQTAKDNLREILGSMQPEDASVWMDEMRVNPQYDYMKSWHYIDFARGSSYQSADPDNLLNALNRAYNEVAQKKVQDRKRKEDIMIIFHLIGDMHQPLHAGYPTDRGGNDVRVNFDGNITNLHHVWDDDIIRSQRIRLQDCLDLAQTLSDTTLKSIRAGDMTAWLLDTRSLLPKVYDFNGYTISPDYLRRSKPIVVRQLLKAGIRLALTLEKLLPAEPKPVVTQPKADNGPRSAVDSYTPDEAPKHIGQLATVCGTVFGGQYVRQTGMTFIDLGAAYPNARFSVVIYKKDLKNFKSSPETAYKGREICITGTIVRNSGNAVIFVSDPEEILLQ